MSTPPDDVMAWADSFAAAVRARDIQAGCRLFAPTARAFGTVLREAENLAELSTSQWSVAWPRTRDFHFETPTLRCHLSADGRDAVLTGLWSSQRRADGARREGRVTLLLSRAGATASWRAVHSHFSVTPSDGGQLD